ncbi:MAG: hypothetical protein ACAI44_22300, partial [Candidatus Sericytochromatia bacterium]
MVHIHSNQPLQASGPLKRPGGEPVAVPAVVPASSPFRQEVLGQSLRTGSTPAAMSLFAPQTAGSGQQFSRLRQTLEHALQLQQKQIPARLQQGLNHNLNALRDALASSDPQAQTKIRQLLTELGNRLAQADLLNP